MKRSQKGDSPPKITGTIPYLRAFPRFEIMNCQDHLYRFANPRLVARRWFLQECGVGLGAITLAQLLGNTAVAAPAKATSANPLAPRAPHYKPRAKRVIFLFMAGAPSHLELFDNKPRSEERR